MDKDDKMLAYFMGQTDQRLAKIEEKLVELIAFRAEVVASARTTAVSSSIIVSLLSLIINYALRKYGL